MAARDGLVVCRSSFHTSSTLVQAGEVWDGDDPVVKNYPAAFRPLVIRSTLHERADDEPKAAKTPTPRAGGRFTRKT